MGAPAERLARPTSMKAGRLVSRIRLSRANSTSEYVVLGQPRLENADSSCSKDTDRSYTQDDPGNSPGLYQGRFGSKAF